MGVGVDEDKVGPGSFLDARDRQANDFGRGCGECVNEAGVGEVAVAHETEQKGDAEFQTDHARGGFGEFDVLFGGSMRGVVGGDAVDGAVGKRFAKGCDVLGLAQRRIDLAGGIVAKHGFVGQQEVMRGDFGGDLDASRLGFTKDTDRAACGDVSHVVAGACVLGKECVPGDDDVLGDTGPAAEAEAGSDASFVHLGACGEGVVLAVLDHGEVEGAGVFEGVAHDGARCDAPAVIGHGDGARVFQVGHFGEGFAFLADGDGGDGVEAAATEGFGFGDEHLGDGAGVVDGTGVGHGADVDEATRGGGSERTCDVFFVLLARLTDVGVEVDETRDQ